MTNGRSVVVLVSAYVIEIVTPPGSTTEAGRRRRS
ncbi:hypothetical protein SCE1572_46205 [Sorangium cellulosum So0157-2]|uniref:Uncharacterized protein n=1 Tax=Sorangium cellulosum So0157-2 TaxID=1254432 RepID=S4YAC1_SORCE|nr:hypothetical protein SCE1572_46205 [Sorangium cellulosum So0157-2]